MNEGLTPELRASDIDRESTIEVLREASVAGQLTMDEFQERMEAAYAAKTLGQLTVLTDDLPVGATTQAARFPVASKPAPLKKRRWIVHLLSGGDSRGPWRDGDRVSWVAVLGGGNIDLRDANLEPGTVIDVSMIAVMGGGDIIVPDNARVEMSGIALMGGRDNYVDGAGLPTDAPLIRAKIFALMGGVCIKAKPPRHRPAS
ncbi:MAG: DUF1707 SHOCT-like domain-containing protein [Nocardioidaceae bacterium]